MIEIEVKARADHERIGELITGLGARAIGVEHHCDTYYNAPHRDFSITDEALRIRIVNGRAVLTYKGKKLDAVSKTREEFETDVDATIMRNILLSLGFVESGVVKKTRAVFEFENFTICLDSVDGLGEFIEVETMVESESDVELHRARVFGFMEKLGIGQGDSIRVSYLEMLIDMLKK
ncbi:MAG TPA: class IV adenylate cyclase [Methanosarcinaceae archaeon]|nr:class IV adenylate cyclase [Methanosarcinaceae archaeon]